MKAIVAEEYGGPEVLRLEEVAEPQTGPNGVLVRIHSTSVNPIDWKLRRGMLRALWDLRFPVIWGTDCSGEVERVGESVTLFKPGDSVYGFKEGRVAKTYRGTYAEYAVLPEKCLARTPATLTHEQAAAVPLACLTAWQGLLQVGKLRPGQRVLIHAGAGGVGTFAVQIAKAFGAEVTGVCSTAKADLVTSLGADHVVDYTREDFTERRYDLVLDTASMRGPVHLRRAVRPGGTLVVVGGEGGGRWLGGIQRVAGAALLSPFVSQRLRGLVSTVRGADLEVLRETIEAGRLTPVLDRTYPLADAVAAIGYIHEGHAAGKVVLTL